MKPEARRNSYIVKMVRQLASLPVEELIPGRLTVSTNLHLATEDLYLKLTTRINWPTGKPGNWVTIFAMR